MQGLVTNAGVGEGLHSGCLLSGEASASVLLPRGLVSE